MKNGMIFVLITALCFTTHEPVSKLFADEINPYAITAIRFFISSLFLLPLSVREIKKKQLKLSRKDFLVMSCLGVLFICVSMVILQVAVGMAESPAVIAIVFSSNSIITIILSAIFLKNKLTPIKKAGVLLCAAGVLFSADFSAGSNVISIILAILSAIMFSIYTVLCKKYMTKISGIIQTGISFFVGSVVLIAVLLILGIDITGGINKSNIMEVMYISVVVTGVGYLAYFTAMKVGGTQMAAMAFMIKPILTPFATFFINGIAPDMSIILALIFVIIGIVLSSGINVTRFNPNIIHPVYKK